jgi:hypothetical protein
MQNPIGSVDPLRVLRPGERQGGRKPGSGDAFRRELGEETGNQAGKDRPVPPALQPQVPGIRKDPQDGSLHVDLLA